MSLSNQVNDIQQTGYCTNVHAGNDLETTRENLRSHALTVKAACSPDEPMGIGLWLSAATAEELIEGQQVKAWAEWLSENGLLPFTLNGFPYGDFHQKVVKHNVYLPTWADQKRFEYTISLIEILDQILPAWCRGKYFDAADIVAGAQADRRIHRVCGRAAAANCEASESIGNRNRSVDSPVHRTRTRMLLADQPAIGQFL